MSKSEPKEREPVGDLTLNPESESSGEDNPNSVPYSDELESAPATTATDGGRPSEQGSSENVNLAPLERLVYTDYAFQLLQPQSLSRISDNGGQGASWVDHENIYNFYIQGYEEALTVVPEEAIPNLYVFLGERDVANPDPLRRGNFGASLGAPYYNHITLDGKIQDTLVDKTFNNKNDSGGILPGYTSERGKRIVNNFVGTEADNNSYYYEWTKNILDIANQDPNSPLQKIRDELPILGSFKNMVIPFSSISDEFLGDKYEYRRQFPMAVKVSIKTDSNTKFGDEFRKAMLGSLLMKEVIENTEITPLIDSSGFEVGRDISTWNKWMKIDRVSISDVSPSGVKSDYYRFWDFGQFMFNVENYDYSSAASTIRDDYIYLYSKTLASKEVATALSADLVTSTNIIAKANDLKRSVVEMISGHNTSIALLAGKVYNSEYFRSYKQILEGQKAYSETLFYKIEKVRKSTNEVINNIYIPNTPSQSDVVEYYDTQVKYAEEYKYNVYAYQIVVGNKYRYKIDNMPIEDSSTPRHQIYENKIDPAFPPNVAGDFLIRDWVTFVNQMFSSNYLTTQAGLNEVEQVGNGTTALEDTLADICVFNEPSLILVEVPQYSFDTIVLDKPPVQPDVELIPYRGVSDRIMINLNGGIGNFRDRFIALTDEDEVLLEKYKLNQKEQRNFIEFKSDDPTTKFQIWRTDSEPKTWKDFNLIKTVDSSELFSNPKKKATAASFKDEVTPNKKYYYTFRSIDVHGNVSNPTSIFEMRMNNDGGTVWMDLETFPEPKSPDSKTRTKSARKFIQIKPSMLQSVVNEAATGLTNPATGERISNLGAFNFTNDPLVLGDSSLDESIWSADSEQKKFKLRVTSKKTGRKIDFNFYCTLDHIKDPDV